MSSLTLSKKIQKRKNERRAATKRILHYFFAEIRKNKLYAYGSLLLAPVQVFLSKFLTPLIAALLVDRLTAETNIKDLSVADFLPYIAAVVGAGLLAICFSALRTKLLWKFEIIAQRRLARKCFEVLTMQSMRFHNDKFSGALVSQTTKFVGAFERFFDVLNFEVLQQLSIYVFACTLLWIKVPVVALILTVLVILYAIGAYFLFNKMARLNEIWAKTFSKQSAQLADSISNILSVKSYGQEVHEKKLFASVSNSVFKAGLKSMRAFLVRNNTLSCITVSINGLLITSVIAGGIKYNLTAGTIILIISYGQQVVDNLWGINSILRNLNRIFGDAYEMVRILDLPNTVVDKEDAVAIRLPIGEKRLAGEIVFDNITFQHSGARTPLFKDFSLHIKPGERVGLVGVSGSGKTTLTKLLLRFADVNTGAITVDGQNIAEITQNSLRENIAYVPQESELFHRLIRRNIGYGKLDAKDTEVIDAAKQANAWDFIETLPEGLNTLTGERGVKLSGGQRQRVIIARAILKNAPILVLDEATSALDSESEKLIQDALKALMAERTSLVIAHRLSTVCELDRIIVLKTGKIVEEGSHKALLKRRGEYFKLWSRQTGGVIE